MASAHYGVIYTEEWVVDLILDVTGYVPGTGISDRVIIEPSYGCEAFLTVIVGHLADDVIAVDKGWASLGNAIRAYGIDSASIETARKAAVETLMTRGCPTIRAREFCRQWVIHGDFILDNVPAANFIVGDPPYVRAVEIDRTKRSLYVKRLSLVTAGCDLYMSFFDRGLDTLKVGGTLCFIYADRWLQNKYDTLLKSRMGMDYDLVSLVRMHGVDALDDGVDAYPAVTTVRRGVAADHLKFVNCTPEFNEADATAVLGWLVDNEPDLVGERFRALEIDKPVGDRMYPLNNHDLVKFVSQACERLPRLEETDVGLGIGIATDCDDVFLTENDDLVEFDHMVPTFYMRDRRCGNDDKQCWLVNPWGDNRTLANLDKYPRLRAYLETNKEWLPKRYVAKKNKTAWHHTIDKLTPGLPDRDLLLVPNMTAQPDPILSHGKYPRHNCCWVTSDEWDLEVLDGLLMADIARRFIDVLGVKMRGGTLRFQAQYLRLVHMPKYIQISGTNKLGFSRAFNEEDRALATKFAEATYKEAIE